MDGASLESRLGELNIPAWKYFDSTGSTNDDALRWAGEGAPDAALVVADHQSAGKGRLQRKWITRPGSALAFSQVFIPGRKDTPNLSMFSPLAGIAVAEALENIYQLSPRIKWPNDVLLSGRKMCGVLVEAFWLGDKIKAVVVGVGINVLQGSAPPDDEVIFPAISIEDVLNQPVDRFELLREVLDRIASWRPLMGTPQFLQAWQERLAFIGEEATIQQPGGKSVVGVIKGIDKWGNLILSKRGSGDIQVSFGDVQPGRPGQVQSQIEK